ncbi:hypothetical protein [Emticicia sp. BO119]|uniref:hypothetical protein n=1 Tax=Emticicia sp. BO119 TaxID=2757768 RepID=UPI0015F11741|nr:hypothetical protein [Emticicia sp. BO119]MBA4849517.1 hypothetical protein [Emticicia sp. BO119]
MKPTIITTILCCVLTINLYAQDIIFLKNGDEIKAKVKEVKDQEITYLKFENLDGPTYSILKSTILMVKYENGQKDIFSTDKPVTNEAFIETSSFEVNPLSKKTVEYTYEKGMADAQIYYTGQNSGKGGVLVTSLLLNGLFGLIPAVACSVTTPKLHNMGIPNVEAYQKNPEYARGYIAQAKKTKAKKVWKNWAIGTAISTIFIIIVSN